MQSELPHLYSMNTPRPVTGFSADALIDRLQLARARLHALVDCLPQGAWLGPRGEHLNPPLWEYGHIVWFQERWCLRAQPDGSFLPGLLPDADTLYDSATVPHDTRWSLALPAPDAVADYAAHVSAAVAQRLRTAFDADLAYFAELSLYHELMHIEAWWMAFQNLGYVPPFQPPIHSGVPREPERLRFAAGEAGLGSAPDAGFVFDNEKWRHAVPVPAFDIDAQPVCEALFAAFLDAGGYAQDAYWSDQGLAWRTASGVSHPLYWRRAGGHWQVRRFDTWTALVPDAPMLHVNRFEAEACAAWLRRQLPSAGQWLRATGHDAFRWGMGWEWLREPFTPYPGFSPDPYADYSQPWFHTHGELRGGGPVTDARVKRPGFRNFYLPHRRDPFAGFRTASAEPG